MRMTQEGLALIQEFEGFRERAYKCPAGVWTIGFGHTGRSGPPDVAEGMRVSRAEAEKMLEADVEVFARDVRSALRRDLTPEQFSALVSFAFNVGTGAFRSSSVLKAVNAGDFDAVPRRLQLWVKAGGRVLPGLVRRRAAEAQLFVSGRGRETAERVQPEAIAGKPVGRSTTIASSLAVLLVSLVTGGVGIESRSWLLPLLALAGILGGAWIIRERLRKAKEEGV